MKRTEIKEKAYTKSDEYYYNFIRSNVRKFRLEKNLTQQNLADMIEMSRDYINDIENTKKNVHPTIATIGRIAEALDKDITEFFKEGK